MKRLKTCLEHTFFKTLVRESKALGFLLLFFVDDSSLNNFKFCRAGSSDTTELWNDIRSSWSIVCLPVASRTNKVKLSKPNHFSFLFFFFVLNI